MSKYSFTLTFNSITARLSHIELIEDEDDEEDDEEDSSSINDVNRRPTRDAPIGDKHSRTTANTSLKKKRAITQDMQRKSSRIIYCGLLATSLI